MDEMIHILRMIMSPIDPNAEEGTRNAIYVFRGFIFFAIFAFVGLTLNLIRVSI